MGFLDRLSGRAVNYDQVDDYEYESVDENYAPAYEDEDLPALSPIRAVEQAQSARIVTRWVAFYSDIRDFALEFREGYPVILNVSEASDAERKRIVDFSLGLCFKQGEFFEISDDVFLLTPNSIKLDVPEANNRRQFA